MPWEDVRPMAFAFLFVLSAVAAGILQIWMVSETRSGAASWKAILFHPIFFPRHQFTEKGLRLRRWWFITMGLVAISLLGFALS
jgi:hypothetical protein